MKGTKIPLMKPTLAPWDSVADRFRAVYESGTLTLGDHTRAFEHAVAAALNVRHVVAVSSCTSGMMLLFRALELRGQVVMPSFTWASTGHAALWNNLEPIFADCTPGTYTLDPSRVAELAGKKTAAVMAVNVFGLYPEMDELRAVCAARDLPFLCDSAQGIGATYRGRVGGALADAEVFSLSPTKVVTAAEGGLVTTNDPVLAERIRRMRDYGKSPDARDIEILGLSARMSEFHAVVGLACIEMLDELLRGRDAIFARYREELGGIDGLTFQTIPEHCTTSGNYFIVFVDPDVRDIARLQDRLTARGVASKRYFHPPLHQQVAYRHLPPPPRPLPVTEWASRAGLALPIYTHMEIDLVSRIAGIFREEWAGLGR
ncbi:MAG: DegT/DnrJ/EryC1/StrS family aminotransferase [Deltaproteobacteria bacterium]|nr:DegT/DnrJ/EryC1/StrS family aminotransferase [Deltaproteobacteria bacterium]